MKREFPCAQMAEKYAPELEVWQVKPDPWLLPAVIAMVWVVFMLKKGRGNMGKLRWKR